MKDYMIKFMKEFDYPEEAESSLLQAYSGMDRDRFHDVLDLYQDKETCDFQMLLDMTSDISKKAGIHVFQGHMVLLIALSKYLKKRYDKKGYSEKMWKDSMSDLKYKLLECHEVKGIWGIFVAWWEEGFFDLTRFAFGRLQFELAPFEGEYYTKEGVTLVKGAPVINVHIPRTLTPLSREACIESYKEALKFFKKEAFVIDSWILYPKYQQLLSEDSNIHKFNSDYEVLFTKEDQDENENLWRLFDMDWTGNAEDYPEDSSLRRKMKQYLIDGNTTGSAYAVYIPHNIKQTKKE